jgi:hypothetical protein
VKKNPTAPAGSIASDTRPPASNAFTSDAMRIVPPSSARYSGLMPYGSRATNIRRERVSQMANANMPRSSSVIRAPSRR